MTMSEAPQPLSRARWPKPRTFGLWGVGLFGVATAATFAVAGTSSLRNGGPTAEERRLLASLEKSLPNTKIAAVSCDGSSAPPGFCEFVAGRNVFYASKDGRYVFLGQVLDIKAKVDLTDRRAKELASVADAEARISGRAPELLARAAPTTAAPRPVAPAAPGAGPLKIALPAENAVVHNRGGKLKLTVFSDYSCGFCRRLFNDLQSNKDVEITEYPIAVLGPESAARAKQVLCAKDRAAAAEALYLGGRVEARADCTDGDRLLTQNMTFAREHGISGTPMLVRSDGATNSGWMPAADLVAWLNGARG